MMRLVKNVWRTYKIEAILTFLGLVFMVSLIYYTDPDWLSPSDTIQTMTLVVLVVVTVSYAMSTRKIYEVASTAERNAVFPDCQFNRRRNQARPHTHFLSEHWQRTGIEPQDLAGTRF